MADAYWNRQQSVHHSSPMPMAKRPRSDYDLPYGVTPGQDSFQHLPRDNNLVGHPTVKDTKSIEESYERYLQNAQHPSFGSGEPSNFSGTGAGKHGGGMPTGGVHSLPYEDVHSLPYGHSAMIGRQGPRSIIPDMIPNELGMRYGGEFPMDPLGRKGPPPAWEKPLPPNASNTIFVDGLPRGITQREVAHIFRPFVGYKEARLVTKEPKYQDADPVVLCFVDFIDAVHAMRAIDALQGYVMDEKDPDGPILRLQFSRNPGLKPGGRSGPRGKSCCFMIGYFRSVWCTTAGNLFGLCRIFSSVIYWSLWIFM